MRMTATEISLSLFAKVIFGLEGNSPAKYILSNELLPLHVSCWID